MVESEVTVDLNDFPLRIKISPDKYSTGPSPYKLVLSVMGYKLSASIFTPESSRLLPQCNILHLHNNDGLGKDWVDDIF